MIPKLYESTETEYLTNGLGSLADAITCVVTEERNGGYELKMVYPVDGLHYKDIKQSRIIYATPADGAEPQPFRIYHISKPLKMQVEVDAEHISYQMSHIPVSPCSSSSAAGALVMLKNNAAEECPFEFWTDISATGTFQIKEPVSMRSRLGGTEGSILDVYGGEWEFDKYTAKLHKERGTDRGVNIRYGKNLTDIKQEENIQNTYTGIYPYWKGTPEGSEEEVVVELSEKVIRSSNYKNFPYARTLPVDFSSQFESKPTESQLRTKANAYVKANALGVPSISIDISFVALWQTEEYKNIANVERVNLCDTVTVEFEKLGVSATAKVVKTEYNVLLERYNKIELGNARSTLASTIADSIKEATDQLKGSYATKSLLKQSVKRATNLITGGLGGYVVLKLNADSQPEEILILADNPDYLKAKKLWRWNKGGLGYSKTGYNGEYGLAITMDGHIVADFVDTGTLTANIIRAGILSDVAGKNFWNMETGEFSLAANTKIGGKTAKTIAEDAVDAQTQTTIFNKLTNNGETQGIYLQNKKLYINASYIVTGILKDVNENTVFNLSTGALTIKKGSINLGNGNFKVSTDGTLTAEGATINGTLRTKTSSSYTELADGVLKGGSVSFGSKTQHGRITFTDSWTGGGKGMGIHSSYLSLCGTLYTSTSVNPTTLSKGYTGTVNIAFIKNGDVYASDHKFVNGLLVS